MKLDIQRLDIRLKGISPQTAKAAVEGLGRELAGLLEGAHPQSVEAVTVPTLRMGKQPDAPSLRSGIAGHIAGAITGKQGGRS